MCSTLDSLSPWERAGVRGKRVPLTINMTLYQACSFGQVSSIQVYVAVGSFFGQLGGAVILRIGMVIIRVGSRMGNRYSGTFLLKPVTASLYPWWLSARIWRYPAGVTMDRPSS